MNMLTAKKILSFPEAINALKEKLETFWTARPIADAPAFQRFEFPIETLDPLTWLYNQPQEVKIFWANRDRQFAAAALGVAHRIQGDGAVPHSVIVNKMKAVLGGLGLDGHAHYYGGLTFDAANSSESWKEFGTFQFILPRFEIIRRGEKTIFACHVSPSQRAEIEKEMDALKTDLKMILALNAQTLSREDCPDQAQWQKIFPEISRQFTDRQLKKIVLARRSTLKFRQPLDPISLLNRLQNSANNSFLFLFQVKGGAAFLGASPERLYRRDNEKIWTEALAGTRPRARSTQEDNDIIADLLQAPKDRQEHQLVVDDLRKRLDSLCTSSTQSPNEVLTLKGGHHLMTRMEGNLRSGINDAEILLLLHPTPAVGGTPTGRAMIEIKKHEPFSRGWYAGPIGGIGLQESELAVAIRSGLLRDDVLDLFAGAGIVQDSTAQNEWEEIEHKLNSFLSVFK